MKETDFISSQPVLQTCQTADGDEESDLGAVFVLLLVLIGIIQVLLQEAASKPTRSHSSPKFLFRLFGLSSQLW